LSGEPETSSWEAALRPTSDLYAEGFIVYELDERGNDRGMIAFATNLLIARAAFEEAVRQRPGVLLQLRHRARIVRTSNRP
jgi:hypothetical protein